MTGKELQKLRKRLGYNQTAFSKKIGISRKTLLLWEKGTVAISEEREKQIKEALGFETGKEREKIQVCIDYLKLTFFHVHVEIVMEKVIGISPEFFVVTEISQNNYEYKHACGSIVLLSRNDTTQGVLLELTGEGLVQFEEHLNQEDSTILEWLRKILSPDYYLQNGLYSRVHSTRIDLAIDEMYDPLGTNFNLKKLKEKQDQDLIFTSLEVYEAYQKKKGYEEKGETLRFGARGNGGVFIRLYEKRFEMANKLNYAVEDILDEYGIWNRYELELGKYATPAVFERFLDGELLEDIAIDILLSYLEIYDEIETPNGVIRHAFVEWYSIFAHWKKRKISFPVAEKSIEKSMRWLEAQVVPTLEMIRQLFGEKWLFDWLRFCMDNTELTPNKEKQVMFEKMLAKNEENGTFLYFDKKMKERGRYELLEQIKK